VAKPINIDRNGQTVEVGDIVSFIKCSKYICFGKVTSLNGIGSAKVAYRIDGTDAEGYVDCGNLLCWHTDADYPETLC